MALGEEKAEAAVAAKAPCPGGWSCPDQELDPARPARGEQPPHLQAEGGLPPLSGVPRGFLTLPATVGLALAPREPASCRPAGPAGSRQRVGLSRLSVPCFPLPAWGLEIGTP